MLHIASDQRAAFLRAARTNNGSVDAPASTAPPAVPPLGAPRLVVPPTVLIGRALELDAVCALLADPACRLVTVLGPGGMGKTRLAVQVADALRGQFADGVVVVALAPLTAPEEVVTAIATATMNWQSPWGSVNWARLRLSVATSMRRTPCSAKVVRDCVR